VFRFDTRVSHGRQSSPWSHKLYAGLCNSTHSNDCSPKKLLRNCTQVVLPHVVVHDKKLLDNSNECSDHTTGLSGSGLASYAYRAAGGRLTHIGHATGGHMSDATQLAGTHAIQLPRIGTYSSLLRSAVAHGSAPPSRAFLVQEHSC
jgi:hypothetical protein